MAIECQKNDHDATTEIYVLSLKQRLTEVSWNWFRQYITTERRAVSDCCFTKCAPDSLEQKLVEEDNESQKFQRIDFTIVLQSSSVDE